MSPIHLAAYNADLDSLRSLLADGHDAEAVDESGFTPLLWSCLRARVGVQAPIVVALIEAGANPNARTCDGDTCLIWAVAAGSMEVVQALVAEGADVNLDKDGVTPLMVAAQEGDDELVDYLLGQGADPSSRAGSYDAAAYAASRCHDALARKLQDLATDHRRG